MKIVKIYSHLNGLEFLKVHRPGLWTEVEDTIVAVDAKLCRTKASQEVRKKQKMVYAPKDINDAFLKEFQKRGWHPETNTYFVCEDPETNRKTMNLPAKEQKINIEKAGFTPYNSRNQTDFVKDRVAVEVQLGKYSFIAYDLFVKHMAFYVSDKIDVGIEIVPMKTFQQEMSSRPGYYENELYNIIREGRGVPAVPLVLVGIDA